MRDTLKMYRKGKEKMEMEMTYGGAMVMPANCVALTEDEMTYVDGGVYFSHKAVDAVCSVIAGAAYKLWKDATALAIGMGCKLAAAWNHFTNWLMTGGVGGAIIKVLGLIGAAAVGYVVGKAWYYDTGIDVSLSGIQFV